MRSFWNDSEFYAKLLRKIFTFLHKRRLMVLFDHKLPMLFAFLIFLSNSQRSLKTKFLNGFLLVVKIIEI